MRLFICLILLSVTMVNIVYAQAEEPVTTSSAGSSSSDAADVKPTAKPEAGKTSPTAGKKKASSDTQPVSLETAYKREYAFLDAQKRELKAQLDKYKVNANSKEQELIRKINALERESVSRSAKIDQFNSQIAEAERTQAAVSERSEALEITYAQAEITLKNYNLEMPTALKEATESDQQKVDYLFKQALSLIAGLGDIQSKPGKFFLENGKQAEGEIIYLGNIAAYGVSAEGSGSLVPAGNDEFKVWKEPAADIAVALSKQVQPDELKLFLYESRTAAIEETPDKTILSVIHSGGIIGWLIVGLGAFALLLIFIRTFLLYKNSSDTKLLSDGVIKHVMAGQLDQARHMCEQGSSAITRVLASTLRHLKDDRDHMENIVHEAILQESGPLDRFGSAILVIASVSPLLGLLGTVTGMISTFDVITEFGTGDPKLLSGGISIALVTTELGLIVAIPALLLGSLLTAWSRNIKRDMEYSALRVTNAFLGSIDELNPLSPNESSEQFAMNPQLA